ncbi:MAG: four-helix bundle copper-binding protein [Bryobacteraceae bacterium]|nr:four-helix bundle copper-binding protein [Bryobacteraceae bacterium]
MAHAQHMTSEIRECIQNCLDCFSICLETGYHCLTVGGKHTEAKHIALLETCARICETSAAFMLSGSEFHHRTCGVCAEVCRACAESCSSLADGDETMRRCADLCLRCAESCRRMSAGRH